MTSFVAKKILKVYEQSSDETKFQSRILLLVHISVTALILGVLYMGYTTTFMVYSLRLMTLLSITSILLISLGYLTISTIITYTGIGILVTITVFGRDQYSGFEAYLISTIHMFIILVASLLTQQRFYTLYTTAMGVISVLLLYIFRGIPLHSDQNPLEIDDYLIAVTLLILSGFILIRTTGRRKQLLLAVESKSRTVEQSLKEKEILLNEIHHRVKNNLNVAISLLRMQMNQPDASDQLIASLQDSINRLTSMALVHERLYAGKNFNAVQFNPYITGMLSTLLASYRSRHIEFDVNVEDNLRVGLDQAIPCGLIINELITNLYKHAYPEGQGGKAWVNFTQNNEAFILEVGDHGVGMDPALFNTSTSLGTKVVALLVEQLGGRLHVQAGSGTSVQIEFPKTEPYQESMDHELVP